MIHLHDLERIDKITCNASSAPWVSDGYDIWETTADVRQTSAEYLLSAACACEQCQSNLEFIITAREWMPILIAEIRKLYTEND